MKNFISLLIITFSLLIISNVESIGQYTCPIGYNTKVVHITYLGCTYNIEFCYKCDPTYPGQIRDLRIVSKTGSGCSPVSLDASIDYIRTYITSATFVFTELCLYTKPGKCEDEDFFYLDSKEYYCYYEDTNGFIYPCDTDNYCLVTYAYCFKNGIVHKSVESFIPVGTIPTWKDCPPLAQVQPGECFMVQTLCNP